MCEENLPLSGRALTGHMACPGHSQVLSRVNLPNSPGSKERKGWLVEEVHLTEVSCLLGQHPPPPQCRQPTQQMERLPSWHVWSGWKGAEQPFLCPNPSLPSSLTTFFPPHFFPSKI